jgi:hypothetical protein
MEPAAYHPQEPDFPAAAALPPAPRRARRRRGHRGLFGHVPLVVRLLCVAGVGLLLLALWRAASSWIITWFGVTAHGEITRRPVPQEARGGARVEFTYRVRSEDYTAEDTVDEDAFDWLHVGTPIEVRVLPMWPQRAQLVKPPGHAGRGSAVGLYFALLGNLGLAFLVRRCLREPLRQRALVREGVATEGVILEKEVDVGRRPSWGLHYSYRAPRYGSAHAEEGAVGKKEWQVRMLVNRADYEAARVGAAVTVLYDPRRPSSSLIYPFADYEAVGTS